MTKILSLVLTLFLFANSDIRASKASEIAISAKNNNIETNLSSSDIFDNPLIEPVTINLSDYKADSNLSIRIIAINKITAKTQNVTLKSGEYKYFDNIKIAAHRCYKKYNQYGAEYQALISISEDKVDEENRALFQGWMLSSDISISTFEHPVYEIFLKDCL